MSTKTLTLPATSEKLYTFMRGKGEVAILDIYRHFFGKQAEPGPVSEWRLAQQRLGTPISRLNRRLRAHRQIVTPGRTKGTYVLTSL